MDDNNKEIKKRQSLVRSRLLRYSEMIWQYVKTHRDSLDSEIHTKAVKEMIQSANEVIKKELKDTREDLSKIKKERDELRKLCKEQKEQIELMTKPDEYLVTQKDANTIEIEKVTEVHNGQGEYDRLQNSVSKIMEKHHERALDPTIVEAIKMMKPTDEKDG